jgi:putative protein-disulfide isomerase
MCFNAGMKPLDLVYFADPMCSWCYGFGPELTEVIEQESLHRPVKLDVIMGGLRAYNTTPMEADAKRTTRAHWQQVQEKTGLRFDATALDAEGFVYDTEPACRAVVTARHLNASVALDLLHAIQRAFYAEGRDVTDRDVLVAVARESGLNAAAFEQGFESQAMKEATRDDFVLTQRVGVTGFPTLCVDAGRRLLLINAGFVDGKRILEGLARIEESPQQEA